MSSEDEAREPKERKEATGFAEEDLQRFETLCISSPGKIGQEDAATSILIHDPTTTLRSELAALEYKRDRLESELQEARSLARARDHRLLELQAEADRLREQAARQNAVVLSLKKRIQELEERERNARASQGRNEIARQALERDAKYREEKLRECEARIRLLEQAVAEESEAKERARASVQEFTRRAANALSIEYREPVHPSPELVVRKLEELAEEAKRVRANSSQLEARLASLELELRSCRDALDCTAADKEQLERRASSQSLELDRLRQENERLEMRQRIGEREANDLRERLVNAQRSLSTASGNIAGQEALIAQLREDLQHREEKAQRGQIESRRLLESLAGLLAGPNAFVEGREDAIVDRVRQILAENKDQALSIESLREKANAAIESADRGNELIESTLARMRALDEERAELEGRCRKAEAEASERERARDALLREKETFLAFLERLARAMGIEEISAEIGVDLRMESLVARAEQLARLETDKLLDKSSVVYQLQRRVRTLREQVQRRDLHLDLLRRKLSLQEDSVRVKSMLRNERDEANLRARKLSKQIDRLQLQLAEERSRNRETSAQLTEAADYKIAALERSRKIEELQKRLVESEMLRTRCGRKLSLLKEQIRSSSETAEQERSIAEREMQLVREELARLKQGLAEATDRESQLQSFRVSVAKTLSEPICAADVQLISRLQKIVAAHRDFTMLSRRYEEPDERSPSSCTGLHPARSPASRCPRYEDTGLADSRDLRDLEDELEERPLRSSLLP